MESPGSQVQAPTFSSFQESFVLIMPSPDQSRRSSTSSHGRTDHGHRQTDRGREQTDRREDNHRSLMPPSLDSRGRSAEGRPHRESSADRSPSSDEKHAELRKWCNELHLTMHKRQSEKIKNETIRVLIQTLIENESQCWLSVFHDLIHSCRCSCRSAASLICQLLALINRFYPLGYSVSVD